MIRLSGRFRSSLIIGLQGIRARKTRTLLSMVSLFLGVLAVVAVQAGAAIAERAMFADLELTEGKEGTRQMYVPPMPKAAEIVLDTTRGRSDAVALLSASAIIGEPGVRPVNEGGLSFDAVGQGPPEPAQCVPPACGGEGGPAPAATPRGQAVELQLTAMNGDVRSFRPYRPVSGQWLSFGSVPSLAPRVVLNEEAAKFLTATRVPAELRLRGGTNGVTPVVLGVVDDGRYSPRAYVRLDELDRWLPGGSLANAAGNGGGELEVLLAPGTATEKVLTSRLAGVGSQVHVQPVQSIKQLQSELSLIRWIFLSMAGLVLLIGVAGILNVGLATVGERVEEFALRRAVGTSRILLAGIVLAETLITGMLTAAAAIGTGVAGLKVVSLLFGDLDPSLRDLQFPWDAGVAGIIAGLIAGVLGGFIPALRAAGIPIATVMRA